MINAIHSAPIITKLLGKVPADMRGSFSDEQFLALKVALGIDLTPHFSFGVWGGSRRVFAVVGCCGALAHAPF